MCIMNGRTTGNSSSHNTCKNVSTVDYFLMSHSLFQYVNMLTVYDYLSCSLMYIVPSLWYLIFHMIPQANITVDQV